VEMDREQTAQKIRNDLKEEKNELKKILNEELGLFGKDTAAIEKETQIKEDEGGFRFEFNEEPDSAKVEEKRERGLFRRKTDTDTAQTKPALKFVIDE